MAAGDGLPVAKPGKPPRRPRVDVSARPGEKVNWPALLLGFGAMVLGQFMAILDIQIVASSLPQIQAGISASNDEISWIQTAYLIPEVVMIPLSGYLARMWGVRNVYLMSCAGFVVMSVATGLSTNIDMMIFTRALQGFLGGAMIPTVWAVAFSAFPPDKRTTAGVIMGLIVTLAPTVGPTLGGHLTELLNWRWLFFINVPVGIVVFLMVARWGNFGTGDRSLAKGFDWWGLGTMAVFLMSMQYVLEEGSRNDWFADDQILFLAIVAALSGTAFVWRSLSYFQPIVELRAFANRNFTIGVIMTFVTGASLFGGTFLMPLFLGRVRGYSASEVGTTMAVSGLTMFLSAPIAGRLARLLDPRILMFIGFSMVAWGMWDAHAVTTEWGFWQFAGVQAFRGVGVMVAMIASQNVTMSTLPIQLVPAASGLVNLARNVGGAMGLALLSTTLTEKTALHMGELSSRITASNTAAIDMIAGLTARMQELGAADPDSAAAKAFQGMISQQAVTLAFGDGFVLLASGAAIAAVASLFAAPSKPGVVAVETH